MSIRDNRILRRYHPYRDLRQVEAPTRGRGGGDEVSDGDVARYKYMCDVFVDKMKFEAKLHNKGSEGPIKIHMDNDFCLQDLFDKLSSTGITRPSHCKSLLFGDLSHQGNAHYHAPKLIMDWEIKIGENCEMSTQACSEGGPTMKFLCSTWNQIETLEVKVPASSEKIALFEGAETGFISTTDESFRVEQGQWATEQVIDKAKNYYRAIGRIMLQSLVIGNSIPDRAMPRLHQNVIFRECDLKDYTRYSHVDVLRDLQDLGFSTEQQEMYSKMDVRLLRDRGILGDDEDDVVTQDLFIPIIHHLFVKSRSIAIDAIKEGLTLNGYVNVPRYLGGIPNEVVSNLVFAKADFDPEDFIRVLSPYYVAKVEPKVKEKQEQFFENVLKSVIRDRARNGGTFIRDLVKYCTGMSYIPHARGITISFSDEHSFPVAYTCVNELVLPGDVYDRDRNTFEHELDQALITRSNRWPFE